MKNNGNSKPRYKQPIRPDSPPPFQKWCERDFRADTDHMSWLGKALYARLLQSAFAVASTRPNLPADTNQLLRLLSGVPRETWAAHEEEILAMFTKATINGVEVLVHKRLQEDFEALADYRFSQSQNKKDYWVKIRAERKKEAEKLATTEPVATHYQYEVDVEVDSDSEKEKEKESEDETPHSPPSPSLPSERARELADYCVEVAKGKDTSVVFFPKSLLNIARVIEKLNATEDELFAVVREAVAPMYDKDTGFCGSIIEGVLAGSIAEYRKNNPKATASKMAATADAPDTWFPPKAPTVPQSEADREAI
jgi:uncharacterized protein YdaU (DUF1376 family)